MAKQRGIRWRQSDHDLLQRSINNFNAKVRRIKKKSPDMEAFLPQTVKRKDVYETIETRADFNRMINSLQRFSKRGAEEAYISKRGAKMTRWEKREFSIKQRVVNQRRERERKRIEGKEVKVGGKGTGSTRAEMGSIKQNELKPSRKRPENLSQKEWDLARQNIDRALNKTAVSEKMDIMRENYIKGLREAGILDADPQIEDLIRGISAQDFYDNVETDETATFQFYKDPQAFSTLVHYIRKTWEGVYSEKGE